MMMMRRRRRLKRRTLIATIKSTLKVSILDFTVIFFVTSLLQHAHVHENGTAREHTAQHEH